MTEHSLLNRPVWNSLSTIHAKHCTGAHLAKRFNSKISPFGSSIDNHSDSLAELVGLIPTNGNVMLMQVDELVCPDNAHFAQQGLGVQMLFKHTNKQPEPTNDYVELGYEDVEEIRSLAQLTKPGPFLQKTHCLGEFVGIKINGKLVAMAGERLKHPGYTEISGVCTHPDFRGRGFAEKLIKVMTRRILNRDESPYLHAYANNTAAIQLYKRLGFAHRANVNVAILEHKTQS